MIVAFVVDTSPSMGELVQSKSNNNTITSSIAKLDLAKMTVESISKMFQRRIHEHNVKLQFENSPFKTSHNLGFGYTLPDQFLLFSTGKQNKSAASTSCGAGGRLLVGFGEHGATGSHDKSTSLDNISQNQNQKHEAFEKEVKSLKATEWDIKKDKPFPEDGGGAIGLNAALSSGLQLISRYRLHHSCTENFGMGRIPSNANLIPIHNNSNNINNCGTGKQASSPGSLQQAVHALKPACLILLTDGECLKRPKNEGGGPLQLQFNLPLRELYREPFRWDQRTFCIGIGASNHHVDNLHPSLKAFCGVTGGCHASINTVSDIPRVTELFSHLIAPSIPIQWPLPNPLQLPHFPSLDNLDKPKNQIINGEVFVNGGPICCFQQLEAMTTGTQAPPIHRAMLLYTPSYPHGIDSKPQSPPIWCIPESFFPSKKIENLPPRTAQPILNFARHYQVIGTNTFDPIHVMKSLHRLDQILTSNCMLTHGGNIKPNQVKVLQQDVYVCHWTSHGTVNSRIHRPTTQKGQEHFPVCIRGAGRPSLFEGGDNILNIGILHIPESSSKPSTLTLLPPDPHVLLPLLLKAAEAENRALKKAVEKREKSASDAEAVNLTSVSKNVLLDENWRSEFRAYLFRLPPYYQHSLRRSLRQLLPARVQSLLSLDGNETVANHCLSRQSLQKIRNGEQLARENADRLERREEEYRKNVHDVQDVGSEVGYGQYDKRSHTSNYLSALRQMPPPWKVGSKRTINIEETNEKEAPNTKNEVYSPKSVVDSLANLPHECLLAYYECRRRWIFGGTGLTTRGLAVEGVNNSGTNTHRCIANRSLMDESLITIAGVGASTINEVPISKMGDFKGRLLFSKQPIIGNGCNDSTVSATTTAADGSPVWSMDDDSLPASFFDPQSGEFCDNIETRIRTKLSINFGNPFNDKRGNSIIPEQFASQRPPLRKRIRQHDLDTTSAQGSPPHDAFSSSVEDEGEAVFVKTSPTHRIFDGDNDDTHGIKRDHDPAESNHRESKRQKIQNDACIEVLDHSKLSSRPGPELKGAIESPQNKPTQGTAKLSSNKTSLRPTSRPPPPLNSKPPPPPPPSKGRHNHTKPPPPPPPNQKQGAMLNSPKPTIQAKNQLQKPLPPPKDAQSPNVKPKVNLPPGWICVFSKSQRRWYYFDQRTNVSVWEWPPPGGTS